MILQHYPRKFWTFVSGFYDFLPAVHFDVFFFVILRCSVVQNVCKDQRKFYGKKKCTESKSYFSDRVTRWTPGTTAGGPPYMKHATMVTMVTNSLKSFFPAGAFPAFWAFGLCLSYRRCCCAAGARGKHQRRRRPPVRGGDSSARRPHVWQLSSCKAVGGARSRGHTAEL